MLDDGGIRLTCKKCGRFALVAIAAVLGYAAMAPSAMAAASVRKVFMAAPAAPGTPVPFQALSGNPSWGKHLDLNQVGLIKVGKKTAKNLPRARAGSG